MALAPFWSHPTAALGGVAALGALFGILSGLFIPRGPITAAEAIISLTAALAIGAISGLTSGSRWCVVIGPVAYAVALEVVRAGIAGPTVDAPQLGAMYGVIAFVLGRVVHGVLVLGPMVLGSSYGVWVAGRMGHVTAGLGGIGRVATALGTLAVALLVFSLTRPASTAAILDASGETAAGSVSELATVPIGGHDQTIMIRGRSVDSPILLYLEGGPGGTDLGALRADVGLEEDFVVAAWDQRGSGKSYKALDPTDTLTVDQMVSDTIEVTEYLLERFDSENVVLVGQSWGSSLGALTAQRRPDLYRAFVGVGQMVSQRATDIMFWEDTVAWARRSGDTALVERLEGNGPPPYEDLLGYDPVVSHEHDWNAYEEFDPANEMPAILFVPEYDLMDRINAFKGFLDTASVLYPQLQDIDFRRDIMSLDIPYYLVLGEHEARGRAVLANEWFEIVNAPSKERVVFPGSGHRPNFERPAMFADLMARVLEETSDATRG